MENSIYIGLSRQKTMSTNMSIVANNIANMNTPGFRGQNILFKEHMMKPQGMEHNISQVATHGQYDNLTPGAVTKTGNDLDVALEGSGFLGIITPDGVKYSRAGSMSMNSNGELVNSGGEKMASTGGAAISIPSGTTEIKISEDGTVSANGAAVGQLMIHEFDNYQDLTPFGNNLYSSKNPGNAAENTKVKQGLLEGSNVNAISEMTKMIDIHRKYQSMYKMMQSENDRLRNAIQKLNTNS